MEEFLEKMLQHSFSIAVASYLLVRMDKRIEELTKAVVHLVTVIEAREARGI